MKKKWIITGAILGILGFICIPVVKAAWNNTGAWQGTSGSGTIDGSGTTNEITYWVDSNTVGALAVATYPSLAELAHGKGVTSAIQDQINTKLANIVEDTTPQLGGALDGQGNDLNNLGVMFLTEQAEAEADVAGKGQVWVDLATPNVLMFTDDVGTDFTIAHNATTTLSSLVTVGTITTGVWNGTDIAVADGGTGASTAGAAATNLGLGTGNSPQFTAVNIGHATDTTLTRVSAGVVAIEGSEIVTENSATVAFQQATTISTAGQLTINGTTAVVFNEALADIDFRIESDANANMFVMDAGIDAISIGETAPTAFGYTVNIDSINKIAAINQEFHQVNISNTGTITTAGSGTHTVISSLTIGAPNIVIGTADVTNSASLYITGAATEADNDYALWIGSGATRLDGTLELGHATDTTLARVSAGVVSIEGNNIITANIASSPTVAGVVELATAAEINTGTDTTRAIPIDQYVASNRNVRYLALRVVEATTNVATATTKGGDFEMLFAGTITGIGAYNDTAGTTGTMTIDCNLNGATIMTTNKITIDTAEKSSRTAATAPALTTTAVAAGDLITIDLDAIHSGVAAKGLTVWLSIRMN